MVQVTAHAAQCWVERVDPSITVDQAMSVLLCAERAIDAAAKIGCHVVRMANGAKLMIRGDRVVTVLFPCKPWSGHRFGEIA
jgi:hypothetical protein